MPRRARRRGRACPCEWNSLRASERFANQALDLRTRPLHVADAGRPDGCELDDLCAQGIQEGLDRHWLGLLDEVLERPFYSGQRVERFRDRKGVNLWSDAAAVDGPQNATDEPAALAQEVVLRVGWYGVKSTKDVAELCSSGL